MVTVTIDSQEVNNHPELYGELIAELQDNDIKVEIKGKSMTDIYCHNIIGIEHKAPSDFVQSFIQGRILQQAKELSSNYDFSFIIVSGNISEITLNRGNVRLNSVFGMISSSTLKEFGVTLLTVGEVYFSDLIVAIIKKYTSDQKTLYDYSPIRRNATKQELQKNVLIGIPAIGPTLADSLIKSFGNLKSIFNATEEQLIKVPGIGKSKAKSILEVIL